MNKTVEEVSTSFEKLESAMQVLLSTSVFGVDNFNLTVVSDCEKFLLANLHRESGFLSNSNLLAAKNVEVKSFE